MCVLVTSHRACSGVFLCQHYSRSLNEFRDYYTSHLKPQFERFLKGGAYQALLETRRAERQGHRGNGHTTNGLPAGDVGSSGGRAMVNSAAAGGDLTFHSGSEGHRGHDGSGGEGCGEGGGGGGSGGDGIYGGGHQLYGSQDQLGAEEQAARNEAELAVYKQIVGSILADEQELAALQRVQV